MFDLTNNILFYLYIYALYLFYFSSRFLSYILAKFIYSCTYSMTKRSHLLFNLIVLKQYINHIKKQKQIQFITII